MTPHSIPASTDSISAAQRNMRDAYASGAPGMLVSATAWLVAGLVLLRTGSTRSGVVTLFAGGMLIFPLSVLACKLLGRSGKHARDNPLGPLALESTGWMIFSLPVAYAAFLLDARWFFPAMMLIIGGRYLVFRSLYGLRLYWACGASLALASYGVAVLKLAPGFSAFVGAGLEAVFAVAILLTVERSEV